MPGPLSYTPTAWADGSAGNTPINSARLNNEEAGILASANAINALISNTKSGIYVPSNWGANWRTKLAAAVGGTGLAKIGVRGDSISWGWFVSNPTTKSYAGLLQTSLQTLYGDGGSGFKGGHWSTQQWSSISTPANAVSAWTTAGVPFTTTGTWATGTGQGPGAIRMISTNPGDTISTSFRGTTVKFFTRVTNGTTSSWTYSIDGGGAVTVTDTSVSSTIAVAVTTVTGLSAGTHTVTITKGSGAASLTFFGLEATNASGVVVCNYSAVGATAGTYLTDPTNLPLQAGIWSGGSLNPADLLIYAFGANECAATNAVATGITLSSSAAVGATTLSLSAYLPPGKYRIDNENLYITATSGTTATLAAAVTAAHSSAAAVNVMKESVDDWRRYVAQAFSDLRDGSGMSGAADLVILLPHIGQFDDFNVFHTIAKEARGLAEEYGAALVDMWSLGRNSWNYWNTSGYWGDGTLVSAGGSGASVIHPSDAGAQQYANALLPILTS